MQTIIPLNVAQQDNGKTVYQYLKHKDLSTTFIRNLKKNGLIRLNGHPVLMDEKVNNGDLIELCLPMESSDSLPPENIDFEILYEDVDLLIINKPAGIAVHPTFNYKSGTLANAVIHYWQRRGLTYRFRAINRLDKDTSGIILIALNLFAYNRLTAQQENGRLIKKYSACVHGIVFNDTGEINLPIGRKEQSIIEREVRADGQEAITNYRVLERFDEMSLLEVQLVTGRTHQIRVHLSHMGHPLVGDDLYGGRREKIKRQALHASSLAFTHPRTEIDLKIIAPTPQDLKELLQKKNTIL